MRKFAVLPQNQLVCTRLDGDLSFVGNMKIPAGWPLPKTKNPTGVNLPKNKSAFFFNSVGAASDEHGGPP